MQIPTVNPHPLKSEIKKSRLRLWQVQKMLGNPSATTISRMLNGIAPMTPEVESGLRNILDEIKKPMVIVK